MRAKRRALSISFSAEFTTKCVPVEYGLLALFPGLGNEAN